MLIYQWYNTYENYGFDEISNGWYQLIYELCDQIEEIYKEAGRPVTMKFDEVKNKFAHLRWYYDLSDDEEYSLKSKITECVREFEAKSVKICEHCGDSNATVCNEPPVFRWVTALCPLCKEARIALFNKKMEERARYKEEVQGIWEVALSISCAHWQIWKTGMIELKGGTTIPDFMLSLMEGFM